VPLFENLEMILESAAKKPLDDEGFRGGLESIQTTLLHIESAVIHDKVNGELIMRVCNSTKASHGLGYGGYCGQLQVIQ